MIMALKSYLRSNCGIERTMIYTYNTENHNLFRDDHGSEVVSKVKLWYGEDNDIHLIIRKNDLILNSTPENRL